MRGGRFVGDDIGKGFHARYDPQSAGPTGDMLSRDSLGDTRGFMLLEVLVAFVIAILALGVMIGAAAGGLQASRTAARYAEATVRAQSRLTEAINAGMLLPGQWEGARRRGLSLACAGHAGRGRRAIDGTRSTADAVHVTVWISWREGRRTRDVRLDTEHIGPSMQAR